MIRRHSLLVALAWLAMPVRFMADGGEGGGATADNPPTPPAAAAPPPVDVEAIKAAATAEAQTAFNQQFKQATGFDTLEAFTQNQLKEQGNFQELADANAASAKHYQMKFHQSSISAALLAASGEAVDAGDVVAYLSGQAVCDDDGKVTVGGKPVAEAVAALLASKPHLAKAQGGTGSGAAQQHHSGKTATRTQFDAMTAPDKAKFIADGGKVSD